MSRFLTGILLGLAVGLGATENVCAAEGDPIALKAASLTFDVSGGSTKANKPILVNGVKLAVLPGFPEGAQWSRRWQRGLTVPVAPEALAALQPANRLEIRNADNENFCVANLYLTVQLAGGRVLHSSVAHDVYWSVERERSRHYDFGLRKRLSGGIELALPVLRQNGALAEAAPFPYPANADGVVPQGRVFANRIVRVRPIYPDTPLARAGRACAVIVTPDEAAYRPVAQRLQAALAQRSGVALPIVTDGEVSGGPARTANRVQIRRLDPNGVGAGGYVLSCWHDRDGIAGLNTVWIKAGSMQAFGPALDALLARLTGGRDLTVPKLHLMGGDSDELHRQAAGPDPDKALAEIRAKMLGGQGATFRHTMNATLGKLQNAGFATGDMRYFKAASAGLLVMADFIEGAREKARKAYGPHYGGPGDIGAWAECDYVKYLGHLDALEEFGFLSDDQRRRIEQMCLDLMLEGRYVGYVQKGTFDEDGKGRYGLNIVWNHETHPTLAFMRSASYFDTYYALPESKVLWKYIDGVFGIQAGSVKHSEDSAGYNWATPNQQSEYAFSRPNMAHYENGNAREIVKLQILCADNLGGEACFGDHVGDNMMQAGLIRKAADYYQDGALAWIADWLFRTKEERSFFYGGRERARGDGTQQKPSGPPEYLAGMKTFAITKDVYAWCKIFGKGHPDFAEPPVNVNVPLEQTFDKISFRTAFDAEAQYFILDGYSRGNHGHFDGNNIIRFTDNNRIWLRTVKNGRFADARFNNVVTISRDNREVVIPAFCQLDAFAELPAGGLLASRVKDYNRCDWTRNIVWSKEDYVAVFDVLAPLEAGDYHFTCRWYTLGDADLDGRNLTVTHGEQSFQLRNADGEDVLLALKHDPYMGKIQWYPYWKQDNGKLLRQDQFGPFGAGEPRVFHNVWFTDPAGGAYDVTRLAPGVVVLKNAHKIVLCGAGGAKAGVPGFATDAAVFDVQPARLSLANATYLDWAGKRIVTADRPVSFELRPREGALVCAAGAKGAVEIAGTRVLLDGAAKACRIPAQDLLPGWEARIGGMATAAAGAAKSAGAAAEAGIRALGEKALGFKLSAMAVLGADRTIVAGGRNGELMALDSALNPKWEAKVGGTVNVIRACSGPNGRFYGWAVGANDLRLHFFSPAGKEVWENQFPRGVRGAYGPGNVIVVEVADLDADGTPEIIAGSDSCYYRTFTPNGDMKSESPGKKLPTTFLAGDMDKAGGLETIAGRNYRSFGIYSSSHPARPQGWKGVTQKTGMGMGVGAVGDVTGDTYDEFVVGCRDLYVFGHSRAPGCEKLWEQPIGSLVTVVETAQLDKNAAKAIVLGNDNYEVLAFDGQGKRLWKCHAPGTPRVIETVRAGRGPTLVVACDNGKLAAFDPAGNRVAYGAAGAPLAGMGVLGNGNGAKAVVLATVDGTVRLFGVE
ncbi:MAG: hypothetical protein JXR37_07360 [Kiritimatiellae bacterium]|nr:hypothetical protein [Kiritimatiellia bacterium]